MPGWDAGDTTSLQALGCLILLPGSVLLAADQTWGIAFALPGGTLLFVGWLALGLNIAAIPRGGGSAYRHKNAMTVTYAVSWVGLVLGLAISSVVLPRDMAMPVSLGHGPHTTDSRSALAPCIHVRGDDGHRLRAHWVWVGWRSG